MLRIRTIALGVLLTFFGVSASHGQSLESLKARFEADFAAFNAQDPAAFVANAHEELIFFGIISPFPVEGKKELQQVLTQYMADFGQVRLTPQGAAFHVSGNNGVAAGHFTLRSKRADGPYEYTHGRYTMTYTQENGQWVLVAMHFSRLQGSYYFE